MKDSTLDVLRLLVRLDRPMTIAEIDVLDERRSHKSARFAIFSLLHPDNNMLDYTKPASKRGSAYTVNEKGRRAAAAFDAKQTGAVAGSRSFVTTERYVPTPMRSVRDGADNFLNVLSKTAQGRSMRGTLIYMTGKCEAVGWVMA